MTLAEKLQKQIESVKPGRFSMNDKELDAIRELCHGDEWLAFTYAFRYGFYKGQRADKAARRRLVEQDKTGWYAYILLWLSRHREDKRLMASLGGHARALDEYVGRGEAK